MQDLSQGTTQQQLAMFKQQITTFEAVLGASTQTPSSGISTTLSMYSENPITLFSNLSSTYVSGSVAQTTGFSTWEKLNGQNYFLWSQSAKMILEGQCKFGFLIGEVYRPPLVIPRNGSRKGRIISFGPC